MLAQQNKPASERMSEQINESIFLQNKIILNLVKHLVEYLCTLFSGLTIYTIYIFYMLFIAISKSSPAMREALTYSSRIKMLFPTWILIQLSEWN